MTQRITVIGAGVVGVCCALWLCRDGHRVTLVDGGAPGAGASSGNACSIAVHACLPINHPDLFRQLPALLCGGLAGNMFGGALQIDPVFALRNASWFTEFLRHCRADKVAATARANSELIAQTYAGLSPLLTMAKCENLLRDNGCLYAYRSERDWLRDQKNLRARREYGCSFREINTDEIRELEPQLKLRFARGAFFERSQSVVNPQKLVMKMYECFRKNGGAWRPQNASEIRRRENELQVQLADGETVSSDKIVIAAGAFSRQIRGAGSEHFPLGTERGYHIQFRDMQHLVSRAVHWVGSGFYATPTDQALRIAGTVEFADLYAPKNQKTLAYLTRKAAQLLPLKTPDQTWLGRRPTFPDARPVIGKNPRDENILFAFGHQHLGLTLAGITGKLIAQLINNEATTVDLTPFSAERFL